jgi:hypothetical protein
MRIMNLSELCIHPPASATLQQGIYVGELVMTGGISPTEPQRNPTNIAEQLWLLHQAREKPYTYL